MCTIGVVFQEGNIHTFKQCDLIPTVEFYDPQKVEGQQGVSWYIALKRKATPDRLWSGVNCNGVGFVAADSYTASSLYYITDQEINDLFAAYETSISSYSTAVEAAQYLKDFYLGNNSPGGKPFPGPDIALHTGWEDEAKTNRLYQSFPAAAGCCYLSQ
jgi:hypothetical protein